MNTPEEELPGWSADEDRLDCDPDEAGGCEIDDGDPGEAEPDDPFAVGER